ncbi:Aste57867_453 [Aphanomyces stellatus]|uniref:Aste57867_453 protein n=1 Tax=Aphanomyces stellatus TaxID=120398 RepID=A0A485K5T3_9STRA|nr:hypothetical protein As57867_000452 [Aphanomyces stellatus]VFT77678.1 Aste57867_453 [Aphanomyces stellatus]
MNGLSEWKKDFPSQRIRITNSGREEFKNMDEVWEIVLGKKVGPLQLGLTLSDAISVFKQRVPVRSFEIEYSDDNPFGMDIAINSSEDGLKLKFNPITQLLTAIEVYQVNLLTLRYRSSIIFGKDISATFLSVYQLLGPTYPGKYNGSTKTYSLNYHGGTFLFPIPKEFEKIYNKKDSIPVEFPNGRTPSAIGFSIYCGDDPCSPEPPTPLRCNYFESVFVDMSDMEAIALSFEATKRSIRLGASPQEIVSELGPPASTFFKSSVDPSSSSGEYFHNYPDLGLDILYSGWHAASKIILRTNIPGHREFNSYIKCNFRLEHLKKPHVRRQTCPAVTPETTWANLRDAFTLSDARPIVNDSGSTTDPFQASMFYELLPGCLVEVLQNETIASITLSCGLT